MLRLMLFGGFTLTGDEAAPVVIASRKSRALLAFLALQARPVPRERLASLLWGDGPEARGRGSLRQALTTLRRELPGDGRWLEATVEDVAIDGRAVWVDAREADRLLRAGEASRALELCAAGELLAGLGAVAPEFDEWREAEERRWRERETGALRTLAEAARAAGRNQELLALGRPPGPGARRVCLGARARRARSRGGATAGLRAAGVAEPGLRGPDAAGGGAPAGGAEPGPAVLQPVRAQRGPAPERRQHPGHGGAGGGRSRGRLGRAPPG